MFSYGGGGASGGNTIVEGCAGTGAGGYPAAGIGGGGAGGGSGTDCTGSGGYSGGTNQSGYKNKNGKNGLGSAGGGYYTGGERTQYNLDEFLGGLGTVGIASSDDPNHNGGNGGTAGKGGNIKKSNTSEIHSYNGNIYSDDTSYNNGENQAYIYAQNGISNRRAILPNGHNKILYGDIVYVEASNIDKLSEYNSGISSKTYILSSSVTKTFDMSKQGVGSGAGYIELSNGTYQILESMN